jgi:hypothetical protein
MPRLQAFSWHPPARALPHIAPMFWADTAWAHTADFSAGRIEAQLKARPPEERALFMVRARGYNIEEHVQKRTMADVLVNGMKLEPHRQWYRDVFAGLKKRDLPLAAIIADEESNISFWRLESAVKNDPKFVPHLHEAFADPRVQAAMPAAMRKYTAEMITTQPVREAIIAWNDWVAAIAARSMRSLIRDTYAEVFDGAKPIVSNWNDFTGAFAVYDINGWPLSFVRTADWSSPECYVAWWGGRHGPNSGLKKSTYWNRFIDCVNYVRSSQALDGGCVPWVSYMSWMNDEPRRAPRSIQWLWTQLIRQMIAGGVERFIYWNPKTNFGSADSDDQALSRLLADAEPKPAASVAKLPEIPLDSDQVQTGDFRTTYADYEREVRDEKLPPMPAIAPTKFP